MRATTKVQPEHRDLVFGSRVRDNAVMRRVLSLGVILAAVSGFTLLAAAPAQAAQFFLQPDSGPTGSTFKVVGAGFLPSEAVRFTWDGKPLAIQDADVNGSVQAKALVPSDALLGGHEVRAEGTSSGLGSSRVFTVTKAEQAASPQAAPAPVAAPAPATPAQAATTAPSPAADTSTAAASVDPNAERINLTPVTLLPVAPDSASAEVAFDVRVPLPGGGSVKQPPEALLLLAFGLLAITGIRTVSLGRRLHIW